MKIAIIAAGTRGDIQPCVALAKGLKNMNIEVIFATYAEYKDLVLNNSIEYRELPENPANKWEANNKKRIKFSDQMEYFGKIWLKKSLDICSNCDAVVYTTLFFLGNHLAEMLNIRHFPIHFEPNITTGDFPSPYIGNEKNHFRILNKFTHNFAYYSFWFKVRKTVNKLREEILEIKPSPYFGYFSKEKRNSTNYLCCFSKELVKKPNDWNENILISGYWFLERESNFVPDPELASYLENQKPIYLDFGSFTHDVLKPKIKIMIDDLSESGEKLLLDPGKMDISDLNLPKNTKIIDGSVPHDWLLPQVKIIITHGGVGAVHAAMRAGVPTVPVTIFPAQHFWGNRVFNLGLGSRPIRIRNLKKGDLLNSIKMINDSQDISSNLKKIKDRLGQEQGIANASKFISDKINS